MVASLEAKWALRLESGGYTKFSFFTPEGKVSQTPLLTLSFLAPSLPLGEDRALNVVSSVGTASPTPPSSILLSVFLSGRTRQVLELRFLDNSLFFRISYTF